MSNPNIGMRLVVSGFAMPVVGYFVGSALAKAVCTPSPPPNQGAAILVAGIVGLSILIAMILVAMGICMLVESDCKSKNHDSHDRSQ
jgi:hypothetical protein